MIKSIELTEDASALRITSGNGEKSMLSAATLRKNAKDASSRRLIQNQGSIPVTNGITITAINQMGSTGLNIQFSDGHNRAIFPYAYLDVLASAVDN